MKEGIEKCFPPCEKIKGDESPNFQKPENKEN